jgi:DNA-binding response OmpR family regulator
MTKPSSAHALRIAIVEDEALIAMEIEDLLSSAGYDVVGSADSAPAAVRLIQDQKPDLALVDVQLASGTNGFEVAAELKGGATAVVFATGNCPGRERDDALGCLHKPYNATQLLRAVEAADAVLRGAQPTDVPVEMHLYR